MLHDYCLISFILDLQGLTRKYLTLISENYTNHYIRLHFEVYVYRFSLKSIPKSCLKEAATASFISLVCLAAILTSIYMEYSIEVVVIFIILLYPRSSALHSLRLYYFLSLFPSNSRVSKILSFVHQRCTLFLPFLCTQCVCLAFLSFRFFNVSILQLLIFKDIFLFMVYVCEHTLTHFFCVFAKQY